MKPDKFEVIEYDVEVPDAVERLAEADRILVKILMNRFLRERAEKIKRGVFGTSVADPSSPDTNI